MSKSNIVDRRFPSDLPLVGSNLKASGEFCNVFSKNFLCDKVWLHEGKVVPESFVGTKPLGGVIGKDQVVVKPHANHCSDPLCPLCCYNCAKKSAKRIMMRFDVFDLLYDEFFEKRHVVVSVPKFDYDKPLSFLRKQAVAFAESVGVVGGTFIFHPKRDEFHKWYFNPHFHIVGYVSRKNKGLVDGVTVAVINKMSGYVLKNLDERKSVVGTVLYQLSHAGVVGRSKSVNWFGELVFKKGVNSELREIMVQNDRDFKMVEGSRKVLCPVCGSKMSHGCRTAKAPVGFDYEKFEDEFLLEPSCNWVSVPDDVKPFRRKKKYSKGEEDSYADYAGQHDG